ncbi:MAG: NAD(P)(+) transhydrogenase (Re/Si-specific) subunit beta [Candidatus Omnitrophica bacterium]|nr:NAD(P)(+) transhydrogenase (Re/Si-specific) subunit beta [Candidatus Omnitrophota bacterium]
MTNIDMNLLVDFSYLISACLFIVGLKLQNRVRTARRGNFLSAFGMLLAIVVTLLLPEVVNYSVIFLMLAMGSAVGFLLAVNVRMTAMPQMVALLNGFGGLASALVSSSEFLRQGTAADTISLVTTMLGVFVGAITFTGSVLAYAKLEGWVEQQPVTFPLQQVLNLILALACLALGVILTGDRNAAWAFWMIAIISSVLGVLLVLPIGGADMPVVISLLNSYSGIAAAITGFVLMNKVLIVAGALVGASGIILCQIMCQAMNRSLVNVMFGGFGKVEGGTASKDGEYTSVKSCTSDEAALVLDGAQNIIIVPGYGLAAGRAQHSIRELQKLLESKGAAVKYAIHPVAGRMPGHMNILLAEAEVPYEQLYEMNDINPEFEQADVALVVGANDVTNPVARTERGSPIYGMPILDVDKARSVIVIKRSLSPGFAGIKNPLFEKENTMMFFADAKAGIDSLAKELKNL